jgi:cytochrome c oxidase subunit IV
MSQHAEATAEIHAAPNSTKAVLRVLLILTVITVCELIVGMFIAPHQIEKNHSLKIWFNIFYLICTLAKAFYIVSEFMHLGHEVRNLVMTIVFPLMLFIWFIIAFLWEGNSYKSLRDTYNPKPAVKEVHTTTPVPAGGSHAEEHK